MENMIESVVIPALHGLNLTPVREGEVVVLRFQGQPAAFDVRITEIEQPALLWLRFVPRIWVGPEATEVLEAITTLNCREWLIKAGRDLVDGEIFFDAELPLYGLLNADTFATYFMAAYERVLAFVPQLLRVQWGGQTARDLFVPPEPPAPAPLSPIEQEVAGIVSQVEFD
jgi:hypothetical protein